MPLILYRRHFKACKHNGRSRRDARSQRCHCTLWVQGTLGGEYVRRSLDQTSWEAGTEVVRGWEAAGRIAREEPTAIAPMPPASALESFSSSSNVTPQAGVPVAVSSRDIPDAVDEYLKDCEARHLTPPTIAKYSTLLKRHLLPTVRGYTSENSPS